jgi:hypothetical protein
MTFARTTQKGTEIKQAFRMATNVPKQSEWGNINPISLSDGEEILALIPPIFVCMGSTV